MKAISVPTKWLDEHDDIPKIVHVLSEWRQHCALRVYLSLHVEGLNKAPFCLSLGLNFWSISCHYPAVTGKRGSTPFAHASVVHHWDVLVKTSRNLSKGIAGCLVVIAEYKIKLRVSEELMYLGANEYTPLILHTKSWEFLTQEWECWPISV